MLPIAGRPKKDSVEAEQPNSPRKPRAGRPSAQDEDSPEDVMGAEDMSPEARSFRYLECRTFTPPSVLCHAGDVRASPVWHDCAYKVVMAKEGVSSQDTASRWTLAGCGALEMPALQEEKCVPGSRCLGAGR